MPSRAPETMVTVDLRPVTAGDRDFLLAVYASTRADELAAVGWTDDQKQAFVRQQFEAQATSYAQHHPEARNDVVVVDGQPAGRLCVDRRPEEIRIVDIALLPAHRNAGIGTGLLRQLMAEASESGRPLGIHVERFNPAMRLYTRLGFRPVTEHGVHVLMEWTP